MGATDRQPPVQVYAAGGITVWHGACEDVLAGYEAGSFDSVITDPPYGLDRVCGQATPFAAEIPTQGVLDQCLRVSRGPVIWFGGARKLMEYARYSPAPERVIVWHVPFSNGRTSANGMFYRWHPILCWRLGNAEQRILERDVITVQTKAGKCGWYHPGTKPLPLMLLLLRAFGGASTCDPYLGSGTTAVAAAQLGIQCVGIEREREYCDIAIRRLTEESRTLFAKQDSVLFKEGSDDGAD